MDLRKLIPSLLASPLLLTFEPYFVLVKAVFLLACLDMLFGLLAASKQKYNSLHPAAILKTFKSRTFLRKLLVFGLFLVGLAAAHIANPLLLQFGLTEFEAGKYFCAAYGLYEVTSLFEKLGMLDMPVAKQIVKWINSKVPVELQTTEEKKDADPK